MKTLMQNDFIRTAALLVIACSMLTIPARADVPEAVLRAEQDRVDLLNRIIPSVVCVFSRAGDNGGSGVLISDDGEALTNFHVIAGLGPFVKCGLADGTINWAVVIGADPTGDLALIKLLGQDGEFRNDFTPATLGDSDELTAGDTAYVIGNPFLLASNLQPTVTAGIVSGVGRYQYPAGTFLEYTECIQTDASINPGNSGGPMFNGRGELIGINGRASFEKRGRVFTGAGYAISINQAKLFLDHLRSGRIVDHGTLGATVRTDQAGEHVYVQRVDDRSDAVVAGLHASDEMVRFGGRAITSANDFKNRLGIYPSGWLVPMSFRQDDVLRRATVRLMPLHTRGELIEQFKTQPFTPPDPDAEPTESSDQSFDEVPSEYTPLYDAAPGFVNLAANRTQRAYYRRGLAAWNGLPADAGFRLSGQTPDGGAVQLASLAKGAAIKTDSGLADRWLPDESPRDLPAGSGGLLVAIEHLRHFVTNPDAYFTDHIAIGSEPSLWNRNVLVDVVVTTRGETSDRWFFDRDDGRLVGFETRINPATAPCVVTLGPLATFGEVMFPDSMTFEHQRRGVLTLAVKNVSTP